MSTDPGGALRALPVHDASGKIVAAIEVSPDESALAEQLAGLRGARTPVANLADLGHGIAETCGQLISSVHTQLGHLAPDDFEVSFGVVVSAEAGIPLITKATGEATITVKATWHKTPPTAEQN